MLTVTKLPPKLPPSHPLTVIMALAWGFPPGRDWWTSLDPGDAPPDSFRVPRAGCPLASHGV